MDDWHIVGNGPGDLILRNNEKVVRFNQPLTFSLRADLTITNSKLAGLEKGFLIEGKVPGEKFVEKLETNSKLLESQLGCKPSLGLLTTKTMLEFGVRVNISSMALMPSLERSLDYDERKALPAAYHNWLGERRIAFLWLDKLNWPGYLQKTSHHDQGSYVSRTPNFSMIQALPSLPRKEASQLLKELSEVSSWAWFEQTTFSALKAIEPLFYVVRGMHFSPNWWLYDNELSIQVNRLHKNLMLAQQALFLSEKVKV
ncbi:hypothetical protein [Vibrio parahaemolyticus]|uniref:hypothetical protein n=1 Tax=Vibrio parahaemolyticus TaxID=670 RepID=UPI002361B6D3|nr:hypothetical protein [Vibrio parahaemolyticus]